jgi:hypothetical protein
MPEVVYVPAGAGWSPGQIRDFQHALDLLSADHGWQGQFRVVPADIRVTTHLAGGTSTPVPDV